MKSLMKAIALVVVIAAPVASFAQTEQPLTRAEVKAQLIQIEQAGYNPAASGDSTYPGDIQAAEARVAHNMTRPAMVLRQTDRRKPARPHLLRRRLSPRQWTVNKTPTLSAAMSCDASHACSSMRSHERIPLRITVTAQCQKIL